MRSRKQMDVTLKGFILAAVLLLKSLSGCGTVVVSNPSPSLAPVPDRYFGMHVGFVTPGTPWPAVPFGTWRLWDADVTWKDLEPAKGAWNFSRLDSLIALGQQHNVDVILPLALTPQWASERPNEPSAYTPGAAAPPTNIHDWTNYVQTVAARYKGKIAFYEMGNEMNCKPMWTGTPEQIVALQQAAYTAIRSADPDARFISANMTTSNGLPLLHRLLELGYQNSADIIGYHFYVTPSQPEAIAPLASSVITLLHQYAVKKPLWNTETGWLPPDKFSSEDQAAAVVVRALLVARASGIDRFLWYEWDNHCCVSLFMTEPDNATPACPAHAFASLQKWLVGNVLGPCTVDQNSTWSCTLTFSDQRHGVILWNPKGKSEVNEKLTWTPTELEDMYGNAMPTPSTHITVGEQPVMLCE